MAHRLSPVTDGNYLEPKEIVRRMRAEFNYVQADADAGTEVVADMLKQFERMKAPITIIEAHRAMLGKSISIEVYDREDYEYDYLTFTAMPKNDLLIGYSSLQHEEAAAPLLERVCKILRYQAKLL